MRLRLKIELGKLFQHFFINRKIQFQGNHNNSQIWVKLGKIAQAGQRKEK